MPAVTVEDILVLPTIDRPDPTTTRPRQVKQRTTAPSGFEGEGFPVRRAFAGVTTADLDPFIHMDQMRLSTDPASPRAPRGTPTGASRR